MFVVGAEEVVDELVERRVFGVIEDALISAGIVVTVIVDEDQLRGDFLQVSEVPSQIVDEDQRTKFFDGCSLRVVIEVRRVVSRADHSIDGETVFAEVLQPMRDELRRHRRDTDQFVTSPMETITSLDRAMVARHTSPAPFVPNFVERHFLFRIELHPIDVPGLWSSEGTIRNALSRRATYVIGGGRDDFQLFAKGLLVDVSEGLLVIQKNSITVQSDDSSRHLLVVWRGRGEEKHVL